MNAWDWASLVKLEDRRRELLIRATGTDIQILISWRGTALRDLAKNKGFWFNSLGKWNAALSSTSSNKRAHMSSNARWSAVLRAGYLVIRVISRETSFRDWPTIYINLVAMLSSFMSFFVVSKTHVFVAANERFCNAAAVNSLYSAP